MEVDISKTYEELSRKAAGVIADVLNAKPNAVLGMATGSSPLGLYQELLLVANAKNKADAVAKMIEGPVTSLVTASALQMHSDAKVFIDEAAAGKLQMREYYEWVQVKKPGAPARLV